MRVCDRSPVFLGSPLFLRARGLGDILTSSSVFIPLHCSAPLIELIPGHLIPLAVPSASFPRGVTDADCPAIDDVNEYFYPLRFFHQAHLPAEPDAAIVHGVLPDFHRHGFLQPNASQPIDGVGYAQPSCGSNKEAL